MATREDTRIENHALAAAAEAAGGVGKLAEALQVAGPTVFEWRSGKRPVPPRRAIEIEKLTGVKREYLSPNFPWRALRELDDEI